MAVCLSYSITYGQIVISEIMYNDPGTADSLEYIELTNASAQAVDLTGYSFSAGVKYTFPAITLGPGQQILVAKDSVYVLAALGKAARQWKSGDALNNSGEKITLQDAGGTGVDSVSYSDSNGWPTEADGDGYSLVLCDLLSDNNLPSSWNISTEKTSAVISNKNIYGTPLAPGGCINSATVSFIYSSSTVGESAPGVILDVVKKGLGVGPQSALVLLDQNNSTAQNGKDFGFQDSLLLNFDPLNELDTVTVFFPLIDDSDLEGNETIILNLVSISLTVLPSAGTATVTIVDNDSNISKKLILTGVFDAQANGAASAKGAEVYVVDDIADLSTFGIGSANNGNGSNGVEFAFPAVSATKGSFIYLAADSALFHQYFGFDADYISSAMNINGDDAIELFENATVIDVFGEIDVDGTGKPWEYTDGWAYRNNGTGPDGSLFVIANWHFGGVGSLDGAPTNAEVANPFPIGTYSTKSDSLTICKDDLVTTDFETSVLIDILKNDILPNGVKAVYITTPLNGQVILDNNNNVTYTPFDGFCGQDGFIYILEDNNSTLDTAEVFITVNCASTYPAYDIATVTTVDANGLPDSLNVTCELGGIIYGNDFQGSAALQFYLIDNTGGISVFSSNAFGYTVKEGDEVRVRGVITHFSGLTQISADTLWLVSENNPLKAPTVVTTLSEATESEFVKINKLTFKDKSQWKTGQGSGFSVDLLDGAGNTIVMRIDNDIDLFKEPAPSYTWLNVTGIGSQFDNTAPYNSGYQILPRYKSDLEGLVSTNDQGLDSKIIMYPNPTVGKIGIRTDLKLNGIVVTNQLGTEVLQISGDDFNKSYDLTQLPAGIYFVTFKMNDTQVTKKLIRF